MIGDSYADVAAAARARVPFLGFAWKSSDTPPDVMAGRLRSVGANCVITDLGALCDYVISSR
jgi:phosphoglycolate phosphatase-like HAD superfamily hydrolase